MGDLAPPWMVLSWGVLGGASSTQKARLPAAPPSSFPNAPALLDFRFVGRPGSYVYVFDGYRMEEASRAPRLVVRRCTPGPVRSPSQRASLLAPASLSSAWSNHIFRYLLFWQCAPGGCLMELCIQLSIIMLGKQLIQNNIFEIGVPYVMTSSSPPLAARA